MRFAAFIPQYIVCAIMVANAIAAGEADVTIQGPNQLDVKESELFAVDGVSIEELEQCSVHVRPEEGKPQVLVLKTLDNKPVLYIKGFNAGKFDIILDVNIPGRYKLVFHRLVIGDGDIVPPVTNGLAEFVVEITADVVSTEHKEVSSIFFALASEIGEGKLRGSKSILSKMQSDMAKVNGWDKWVEDLKMYLLKDLSLISQKQWQDAFLVVGKEVAR